MEEIKDGKKTRKPMTDEHKAAVASAIKTWWAKRKAEKASQEG